MVNRPKICIGLKYEYVTKWSFTYCPPKGTREKKRSWHVDLWTFLILDMWKIIISTLHPHYYFTDPKEIIFRMVLLLSADSALLMSRTRRFETHVIHLGLICPYKFLKHWIIWKSCRLLVKWIYDSSAMWFTSMKDVGKIKFTVSQRTPSLRHLPCLSSDFSFLFFFFFLYSSLEA